MHFRSPGRQRAGYPDAVAFFGCHPDPPQDGEGPLRCNLRFLLQRTRGLQLRGPSPRSADSG
jgi:hypothetical protein